MLPAVLLPLAVITAWTAFRNPRPIASLLSCFNFSPCPHVYVLALASCPLLLFAALLSVTAGTGVCAIVLSAWLSSGGSFCSKILLHKLTELVRLIHLINWVWKALLRWQVICNIIVNKRYNPFKLCFNCNLFVNLPGSRSVVDGVLKALPGARHILKSLRGMQLTDFRFSRKIVLLTRVLAGVIRLGLKVRTARMHLVLLYSRKRTNRFVSSRKPVLLVSRRVGNRLWRDSC